MSTVQGYQCDQCGTADLKPHSFGAQLHPEATRGWHVSKATGTKPQPGAMPDLLWFCTTRCALAYLSNVRGDCCGEQAA